MSEKCHRGEMSAREKYYIERKVMGRNVIGINIFWGEFVIPTAKRLQYYIFLDDHTFQVHECPFWCRSDILWILS